MLMRRWGGGFAIFNFFPLLSKQPFVCCEQRGIHLVAEPHGLPFHCFSDQNADCSCTWTDSLLDKHYIHIHMCVRTPTPTDYPHTHTHAHTRAHAHRHTPAHAHTRTRKCTRSCTRTCTAPARTRTRTRTRTCGRTHVYMKYQTICSAVCFCPLFHV